MRTFYKILLTVSYLNSIPLLAEDEIIRVSAPRNKNTISTANPIKQIYYSNKFDSAQPKRLEQDLQKVSGLHIARQGGPGKTSSLYLRGANASHTLVIIDGVAVNDPSSPNRSFDFNSLNLDQVESIKVLKGPQSVIYGSDALAGVIEIKTRDNLKKNQTNYSLSSGPNKTNKARLSFSKKLKRWSSLLSGSFESSDGISSANELDGNTEKDGYELATWGGSLQYDLSKTSLLQLKLRGIHQKAEIDNWGAGLQDDPNSVTEEKKFTSSLISKSYFGKKIKSELQVGYFTNTREDQNRPDAKDTTSLDSYYRGDSLSLDWSFYIKQSNAYSFRPGLQLKTEQAQFKRNDNGILTSMGQKALSTQGLFLNNCWKFDRWETNAGIRYDRIDAQTNAASYSLNPNYQLSPNIKTSLNVGSGFKTPSLFQLHDQTFGDENLQPEKVIGVDLGLEGAYQSIVVGFHLFQNNFENLISTDSNYKYINVSAAKTQGIESEISFAAAPFLKISTNITYLDARNLDTQKTLERRPYFQTNTSINYQFNKKTKFSLENRFVGTRADRDAQSFERIKMPSYSLWSLESAYQLNTAISLSAQFENILNTRYEEIEGYGTLPFSVSLALSGHL